MKVFNFENVTFSSVDKLNVITVMLIVYRDNTQTQLSCISLASSIHSLNTFMAALTNTDSIYETGLES